MEITSKKAAKLFQNEPTQAQIAQWYSDFLSESGKAVLPPISGLQWTQNSMEYTEMILASADGDMEKFVIAPARYTGLFSDSAASPTASSRKTASRKFGPIKFG